MYVLNSGQNGWVGRGRPILHRKLFLLTSPKKKGKAEANLRGASLFDRSLRTQYKQLRHQVASDRNTVSYNASFRNEYSMH